MCGFAGIVNFADGSFPAITEELLRRIGGPVAHRGPDGSGTFISPDGRVGLIHYRLAIVDLPGGAQPMSNEDNSIWIVYNGEVYNHAELRAELQAAGHRFKTDHCDTEVIIHGYEQWGEDCPKHLRGQFAFAVVDLNKKSVFLARDRLGQKPLYYATLDDETLLFASCPQCLLVHPSWTQPSDARLLCDYLRFGYMPDMETVWPMMMFRGSPGYAHRDARSGKSGNNCYWAPPAACDAYRGDLDDAIREVRPALVEATEVRLHADVEVGCFLSGGTDSAIIASIVRRVLNRPIRTFTIGMPDPAYDEREPARQVAKELGTEHVEFEVQPEHLLDVLDDMIETVAEPFADSSIIPTHWVAKLTRQHVKVALSGDGGDEAFCGYDRYKAVRLAHRLRWTRPFWRLTTSLWRWLGQVVGGGHRDRWTRLARLAEGLAEPLPDAYRTWVGLFTERQVRQLVRPDYWIEQIGFAGVPEDFASDLEDFGDPVQAASRIDYGYYLPGDILTKVDRASMRVALEVRSPFLDHKVVELALSLPSEWKLRGRVGKWILREAFKDIVPASVWAQPKRGFALPLDRWFRDAPTSGRAAKRGSPDAGQLLPLLRESVALLPGDVFNHAFIDKLIAAHASGREEHSQRLWALLWLGRWWKRFVAV